MHSKNGCFTVKSAYFVAAVFDKFPGGVGRVSVELWKRLWACNLPPKYALFLWKVLHPIIAVKDSLKRRNIVNEIS